MMNMPSNPDISDDSDLELTDEMESVYAHTPSPALHEDAQEDVDQASLKPSKTQRKQAAQALTDLGRQLVELKPQQLARIDLSEEIAIAVLDARKIKSHVARKRQLQYLGKLLRNAETDEISQQLEQVLAPGMHEASLSHQAEFWREQLLERGHSALAEFLQQYPTSDHQQLRQYLRQASQQGDNPRIKHAKKLLYRELHQILNQHSST